METARSNEEAANGIPIIDIQPLISGTDDGLWPSSMFSDRVVARLKASGFQYPVTHLRYEGAGHLIGPNRTSSAMGLQPPPSP